ncbi:MAG: ornithine cyclodeaminase family protein [Mycobacteriales bacterium]
MLVLDATATRDALPIPLLIRAMRQALVRLGPSSGQPPRTVLSLPGEALTVVMPAISGPGAPGVKVVSVFPTNVLRGLAPIQGFVALLSAQTGELTALLDGAVVTELRTAAVSALATDVLARPGAESLALLGAGTQAHAHLLAVAAVRPIREVRVWSRSGVRAKEFAAWAETQGHPVLVCREPAEAVTDADVVCTVTASPTPVLSGAWLRRGAHVNAVGAFQPHTRELTTDVVTRATVVVDSRAGALSEAGDLLIPMAEGAIDVGHLVAELSDVLAGRHPGRRSPQEITVFESLGLAVEDVAAAELASQIALDRGLGVVVEFGA